MDDQYLTQFLTKIDVIQDKEHLSEDEILFMVIRGILNSSPTIVSRALLAVRSIIIYSSDFVVKLMLEANKFEHLQKDPPTHNSLFCFLLARCNDERVNSRKAAILALEALYIYLNNDTLTDLTLELFQTRCRDHSLTVRKQAAESLTRILQKIPGNENIELVWLRSVMAMIVDRETSVQQFCAKLIADVLIFPIMLNNQNNSWKLLSIIEREVELKRLLLRVLIYMNNEKIYPLNFLSILKEKTQTSSYSNAAWMLLGELSAFVQVDITDAVKFWSNSPILDNKDNIVKYVCKVLSNGSHLLNDKDRGMLKHEISNALYYYKLDTSHISSVYYAFAKICNAIGDNAEGKFVFQKFNEEFYNNSLKELDSIMYDDVQFSDFSTDLEKNENILGKILNENTNVNLRNPNYNYISPIPDEEKEKKSCKLERIIFCIGECLQYTSNLMSRSLFKILKVIVASDKLKEINPSVGPTPRPYTPDDFALASSQGTSIFPISQSTGTNLELGRETPAMMLKGRVLRHEFLTKKVRAEGVLTLGKLCLLDERLAKKCVPVFVRELKMNNDYIIRNNIVVAVCDLCIRYTLLVDRYSAILASCLNDSSVLVRQQTLMLLTNLIKEQFLKWEGSIIYRFVTALLDPHKQIRDYAVFCLTDILLPQFPMMFFNHFLECLFYFNQVNHQSWSTSDDNKSSVSTQNSWLSGSEKYDKRMVLYQFMMKTFTDDQKYKICERISCEIFAAINDNESVLQNNEEANCMLYTNPNVIDLLTDAFRIMSSQEIKFSLQVGQRPVDDQADEDDPSEERTRAAKRLIAKVFGDKVVDATIPHLLQLREFLIEKHSPLVHNCFAVIISLYKDHQQSFDDIFASDSLLKSEIEFYLKQERRAQNANDEEKS